MKNKLKYKLESLGFVVVTSDEKIHIRLPESKNINQIDANKATVSIQLIESKIDPHHFVGSCNDTPIKAISCFNIEIPVINDQPDFYIFSFDNQEDSVVEFIVIPLGEFKSRLIKSDMGKSFYFVFWLLPNGKLFETTNISPEGEWFFMSGGGAMAEGTDMDYSEFRNNWELIRAELQTKEA